MRILVTGSKGQLGNEFLSYLEGKEEVLGIDIQDLDLTKGEETFKYILDMKPDVILHCAAFTNVDKAESDLDNAFKVNVIATQNVAAAANEVKAKLVYISTDFVFDGMKNSPYIEFDLPNPLSNYGKTKLYGECILQMLCNKFFIVRTSWLYGDGDNNFIGAMLRLAQKGDPLNVVDDQFGSPTYTRDLVKEVYKLIKTNSFGIYHITNKGETNWFEFAKKILELSGLNIKINPITSKQLNRPAVRPKYSVLENKMLAMTVGDGMRDWSEALKERFERTT